MIKLLTAFFVSLPEIIRLLKVIAKNIEEAETNRKVKDDLKAIEQAFRNKDSDALNRIMGGK